ncbi:MAG: chromosomal replication initiator protein DnaA [Firmicutes bacterium]|nr:chromosomal replication initiator protein DnaA [Bacillota bacterium]
MDLTQLWNTTLASLEGQLPKMSYEMWLKNATPIALHNDTVLVAVSSDFARDWLESNFLSQIKNTLQLILERPIDVKFVTPPSSALPPSEPVPPPTSVKEAFPFTAKPLNPKYTFETFVVGSGNRFAHAAALAVADAPARAYNPLFLYGGVGLGKTHLMQAIGHSVFYRQPSSRVVYVSAETFTNDLINAIRDTKTVEFRQRYRNVDVLLIDDIQFIAGKESSQEEFFHTFDSLHQANKQIVISSDRPPRELSTLEERLRTRFEWGLITDIQPPDLETRVAILRKKATVDDLPIPDEVMLYIATQIEKNIRELEGALIRAVAYASIHHRPLDLPLATEALKDFLPSSRSRPITIQLIQEVVAAFYSLRLEDLKIQKRTRAVAFPRQVAMYLCRELTDHSLPRIGYEFGGRDHTTVLHACDKVAEDLKNDPHLQTTVHELVNRIKTA